MVLHRPTKHASYVTHTGVTTSEPGKAEPALLHVPGDAEEEEAATVIISLSARPNLPPPPADGDEGAAEEGGAAAAAAAPPPPFGACMLTVCASDWQSAAVAPAVIRMPVLSAGTVPLTLPRGATYAISTSAVLPEDFEEHFYAEGYAPQAAVEDETVAAPAEEGAAAGEEAEGGAEGGAEEGAAGGAEGEAAGAEGEAAAPVVVTARPDAVHVYARRVCQRRGGGARG